MERAIEILTYVGGLSEDGLVGLRPEMMRSHLLLRLHSSQMYLQGHSKPFLMAETIGIHRNNNGG